MTRLRPRRALVAAAVAANVALVAVLAGVPGSAAALLVLIVLGLVLVGAAAAVLVRPQRGVLVLAALLPYDGLREVVPFPAGWKEALVLLVLAATFVAPDEARAESGRRLPHWVAVTGVFAALGVVSALAVGGTQGLVGVKVGFFYLLLALAVWRCPLDRTERDRLVTIIMVNGVVTAAFGIVQQVLGHPTLNELGWEYNSTIRFASGFTLRSFSTFNQPFPFALFLMLAVLIGVPCALADPQRRRNRLFLLALPVIGAGLVFTVTRAAWLGIAVGITYIALTKFRSLLIPLAHLVAIGIVALVLVTSYSAAFLSRSSSEERFDIWRQNTSAISSHPLGMGIGASGSAAEKAAEIEGEEVDILQPDNYYFKTALELGVIGLWLLVLLFVTTFSASHVAAHRLDGVDGAFASGVAGSILAAAAVSFVATYFEIFPLDAYFWLLLAVVATCVSESR
ncbi:MAG: O-antigen ligase family protein [Actinomycetota bacterium]